MPFADGGPVPPAASVQFGKWTALHLGSSTAQTLKEGDVVMTSTPNGRGSSDGTGRRSGSWVVEGRRDRPPSLHFVPPSPRGATAVASLNPMIPVLDPEARRHFRQRLRREFAERCSRNPRYSLRAFARWLRVDHATVAALIRGTRTLTPAMLTRLAVRLGLGAQEVEQYRLGRAAEAPQGPLEDGILDLVGHPDFRADTRWMGRILGVGTDEVSAALPDLLRTNRLVMDTRRRWAVRTPAKAQPPTRS